MMIKICGITNREDAVAAVDAGVSALGFNFYSKSPRCITPEMARDIGAGLPVLKVGVFVDDTSACTVARHAGLDVIQLHGNEAPGEIPGNVRVWKAFKVTPQWDQSLLSQYTVEAFLLDGPEPGQGMAFDWLRAAGLANVILAGGLGPDNVAEAIRLARPWGVDACSRLERAPGLKDHEEMRRFVRAAMDTL
jgi:phosphoribosylanthranilate isomerase